MNLEPASNDHFFVDFLQDTSTGEIGTTSIKNLGTEYGLRWHSKRAIGKTMAETLAGVPMLLHPVELTFAKQRYDNAL
jgi:hypothetical protein